MEEEMGLEKSRVQVWAQMPAMPDRVITSSVFIENGLNPGVLVAHIYCDCEGESSSENTHSSATWLEVILWAHYWLIDWLIELTAQDSLSEGRSVEIEQCRDG